MKLSRKLIITILTLISIIIIVLSIILDVKNESINSIDLIFHGLKIVFITYCLINLENLKENKIFLGYIFIFLAWIWNFIDTFIPENSFTYILHTTIYEVFSLLGIVILAYGIFHALSDNKSLIEKLKTLAYYDQITKLPNRNMIMNLQPITDDKNRLAHKELVNLDRECSLFFIDIDDFKIINDNLGHYYGDLLLEEIAIRFKSFLDDEDIIIHLSGDEFLIVVYDICLDIDLREKANRIIDEMRKSFVLNGKEVHISCSVGIALYPEHGDTIEEVMQKADISMYKAKNEGKNQVVIYNDKIEKFMNSKFEMISDLKTSVKNNDFVVHYQTKATTEEGEITGLEALVRWNHPTRGLVYPNDFIPLAEEIGVIKDIDIFVLNKACQQIEKWMKENKNPYNISVNISPIFFNQNSFILTLDKILSQYEINPSYISVEITENIALKDIHLTQLKINQLKKRNIKVHLDDFGRGYSSLSYIKDYPVDYLKIDKVFIDDIINNEVDQTLVKTIVNVSNLLGIKVIFEGVETKEQLDVLKKIGCNEYQGYFLSKPKPIDDIDLKF